MDDPIQPLIFPRSTLHLRGRVARLSPLVSMGNPQDLRERVKSQRASSSASHAAQRASADRRKPAGLSSSLRHGALVLAVCVISYVAWFGLDMGGSTAIQRARRAPVTLPVAVLSSCTMPGMVALTFDNGPGASLNIYLDSLQTAGVKAAFHFNSKVISSFSNGQVFARRAADNGHLIGLRFNPDIDPTAITNITLAQELVNQSEVVHKATGQYPKFIRYTFGQLDDRVEEITLLMGMEATSYNVDANGYNEGVNAVAVITQVFYNATQNLKPLGASIVSVQQDSDATVGKAMGDLITTMKGRSYTFVRLDTCVGESVPYRSSNNAPSILQDGSSTNGTDGTTSTSNTDNKSSASFSQHTVIDTFKIGIVIMALTIFATFTLIV